MNNTRDVALRKCRGQSCSPYAESGECIIDLGLRETPLRIGHVQRSSQA
jgi:hypothetical protein